MEVQIEAHKGALARGQLPPTCLMRLCGPTPEVNGVQRGRRPGLIHGEVYESVEHGGQTYALTPSQSKVIRVLNEAWEQREPPMSWATIRERSGSEARSLSDVLGSSPLWKTLVVQAGARGVYTLSLPEGR